MTTLHLILAASIPEVARLAQEAGSFAEAAGLGGDVVARLLTVLDEVVTNAITHGRVAMDETIRVELTPRDSGLDVVVEDPGPPFDPLHSAHAPVLTADVGQRPVGGLGIYLLQRLATDTAYVRTPEGRNRLSFHVS